MADFPEDYWVLDTVDGQYHIVELDAALILDGIARGDKLCRGVRMISGGEINVVLDKVVNVTHSTPELRKGWDEYRTWQRSEGLYNG